MALFKRFQAIYGVRWDDQFPTIERHDAALAEWGFGLAGMTADQIKRGIDRARVECEWPPSIARFVALGKSSADTWEHAGPAYRLHVPALRKPKAREDVVRGALASMRSALRGARG